MVGQDAATTSNPLNQFIGAAGAAASQVKSAASKETSSPTSSSSASASPAPTTAPAVASPSHTPASVHHGLSQAAKIGIIVGCVVGAVLLLALLGLCCCVLLRRRHKHKRVASPIPHQEPAAWKSPINPGRHYSNYTPAQHGNIPMEQHPTVPLMAAAATEQYRSNHSQAPSLSQHPAMRQNEKPFVPVPPSPRRSRTNSRNGLSEAPLIAAAPHMIPKEQLLRDSGSHSISRPNSSHQPGALPTHTDANRPPTPFGLSGFGTPAGHTVRDSKDSSPLYSGIGQPYEDMHVHVLQTETPSRELRHSPNARQTAGVPTTAYDSDEHVKYRNSRGYSTPPEVPSRSPNRDKRASMFADSSYDSSLSTTTNSSGERYQRIGDPYAPAQRESVTPWEQHQQRFTSTPRNSDQIAAPPIPWEDSEYNINKQRRQSHSPRQSMQYDGRRRSSRSPGTNINGQPRRLRFEDLQASGGREYQSVPGQRDTFDGYDDHNRWSQGVGEAL